MTPEAAFVKIFVVTTILELMDHSHRKAWDIQQHEIATELAQIVEFTDRHKQLLVALRPVGESHREGIIEAFKVRLYGNEQTKEFLDALTPERGAEVFRMVGEWWMDYFSGDYDQAFTSRRLAIGHIHARIGLPLRYPLAMIETIADFGDRVSEQSESPKEALAAFRKVMALDVAIFNQAFENKQLDHLSNIIGGEERLARRLLTGSAHAAEKAPG